MNDATQGGRSRRWSTMAGLVAGGAVAGAVLAGVVSANAATTSPSPSASSGSSSSSGSQTQPSIPAHGSAAHEDAEKPVTGDAATKAKAAAVASVGSGTAGDVTTDFTGDGYEVTVTKADGTKVEVHLDSSFAVVQHGGGRGDHGSAAEEAAEKPVTGDAATKAKAAAVAAVGGTAGAVTTDSHGDGYEVTVTKADGTTTEVHLNASFEVQPGGPGGHGPGSGPGNGPGDGNGPGSGSGTATPSA